MNCVLVGANDVLCDANWKVNSQGRLLVMALSAAYRVVIGLEDYDVDRFNAWAKMEGLVGYQEVLPALLPIAMRGGDERLAQIDNLLGRGYAVDFLIDSSPDRVRAALEQGVNALLFAHAKFMRPEFRPDYVGSPKPWDDIVAEINHQAYLQSNLPAQPE